ncbi:hypothetical protein B0H13DRAFT_2449178 [Mycena leptocephala]|nr:hypothetical protein B0H13DRAFT_2449178 [Mycena leptocephala]
MDEFAAAIVWLKQVCARLSSFLFIPPCVYLFLPIYFETFLYISIASALEIVACGASARRLIPHNPLANARLGPGSHFICALIPSGPDAVHFNVQAALDFDTMRSCALLSSATRHRQSDDTFDAPRAVHVRVGCRCWHARERECGEVVSATASSRSPHPICLYPDVDSAATRCSTFSSCSPFGVGPAATALQHAACTSASHTRGISPSFVTSFILLSSALHHPLFPPPVCMASEVDLRIWTCGHRYLQRRGAHNIFAVCISPSAAHCVV